MIQVNLSENRLCGVWQTFGQLNGTYTAEGINAIADALLVTGSLTSIDLALNRLGVESAKALAPAITASGSLTSVNLYGNHLGAEGAKALAPDGEA